MITAMDSERSTKRRRTSTTPESPSPSISDDDTMPETDGILARAMLVLQTEATALANVATLYRVDATARDSLKEAVSGIVHAQSLGGKLITCGVGKSAYIAMKLVATCKSLGIAASFMHACEAVHGDLGDIRANDVLLFISFSGKTPELLNVLGHVPSYTRIMALSSHATPAQCPLLCDRGDSVLLPTPIPEKEEVSFGIAAPTTSTTVSLAVADMLALTVAEQMHRHNTKEVFQRNHPGGAIGMTHREVEALKLDCEDLVVFELPSPSISGSDDR